MDLGIYRAGFNILCQIEADEHCCATLRAAKEREKHPTKVIETDIQQIAPETLMEEPVYLRKLSFYFGLRQSFLRSGTTWA